MGAAMGKIDAFPSSQPFHICLLGLDSAGKTTALYRMKFEQYINAVPTIGFNVEKVKLEKKGISFLIWDVGGQEKIRPLWNSYTRCTDGIIFVIDSCDVERIEEAKMELMKTAKCSNNQGTPLLILANKQDLPQAKDIKDLEKLLALHELTPFSSSSSSQILSKNLDSTSVEGKDSSCMSSSTNAAQISSESTSKFWHIQPACAITGEGLFEGLEHLYEMILRKRKLQKQKKK